METDLAVMMPHQIASGFVEDGAYATLEFETQEMGRRNFAVSLH